VVIVRIPFIKLNYEYEVEKVPFEIICETVQELKEKVENLNMLAI
jgi:hypothetical protein